MATDPSVLIGRLLAAGHLDEGAVVEHLGHMALRGYAAVRHPDDPFDQSSGVGRGRRLLFQDVSEAKSGKNLLHLARIPSTCQRADLPFISVQNSIESEAAAAVTSSAPQRPDACRMRRSNIPGCDPSSCCSTGRLSS